ncbi:hypothetical protein [Sphingomonas sp.]|uniref:hypothetical protein n=1 Tax=Sphingomonas sp. TaxID=28214 RepID=UPI000DB260C2|nr:hypothetical protein [Sphingomonas sp.]PZU09584.1 MAG: hypothetical protein DI605_07875 [Sphingomonas sp.]
MGATTVGALVGGAIDAMSGDDSAADGALVGAITANVLKVAIPVVITYAVGWAVLRGLGAAKDRVFGEKKDVKA